MEFDCGLVLTAHPSLTGLNTGSGTSGSTQWKNKFRAHMYFRKGEGGDDEADKDYRELEVMKANFAPDGEIVKVRWSDGVFVPDKMTITEVDATAAKRAEEEDFLARLDEYEQQGREVSHKPKANNYAPTEFGGKKSRKKDIYEQAMERLFKQNRIRIEQYGSPSRGWSKIVRNDPSNPNGQGAKIIDFPGKDKPAEDPDKGA